MISPYAIKSFIVVVVMALIGLDVYLATDGKTGNTYSEIIRTWFARWEWLYYSVAFALGVLMSHWGTT